MATDQIPSWLDREVACFLIAAIMVTTGTVLTGFLPDQMSFQVVAGALILGGFVVIVVCLREEDAP